MKVRKPTAEYFGKVVAGTGLRPEEIVFVDDAQSNVDAAAALGFQAIHFVPGGDLRKTLKAYI